MPRSNRGTRVCALAWPRQKARREQPALRARVNLPVNADNALPSRRNLRNGCTGLGERPLSQYCLLRPIRLARALGVVKHLPRGSQWSPTTCRPGPKPNRTRNATPRDAPPGQRGLVVGVPLSGKAWRNPRPAIHVPSPRIRDREGERRPRRPSLRGLRDLPTACLPADRPPNVVREQWTVQVSGVRGAAGLALLPGAW